MLCDTSSRHRHKQWATWRTSLSSFHSVQLTNKWLSLTLHSHPHTQTMRHTFHPKHDNHERARLVAIEDRMEPHTGDCTKAFDSVSQLYLHRSVAQQLHQTIIQPFQIFLSAAIPWFREGIHLSAHRSHWTELGILCSYRAGNTRAPIHSINWRVI